MSKLGTSLKRFLDRPGLRWILGAAVTANARRSDAPVRRVRAREGLWVHECRDGFVVDRRISTNHSLAAFDEVAAATWGRVYTPSAGDVVVDVGAGIGSEAHWLSLGVGPSGRVIAIEAHPETFRCLRLFCELNRLENFTPLNLAVSDASGTVTIADDRHHISSSILGGGGDIEVRAVTLDGLLAELGVEGVDYLKMNIEGAESLALRGMAETARRAARVSIACHDFKADKGEGEHFRTKAEVRAFLEGQGFTVTERAADPRGWVRDQLDAVR